jgi:4-hydroxy-tetrahydrodipicolinate reductase
MRIAVVGHGRMGHEVEAVARERGHEPVVAGHTGFPAGAVVGIDFTRAESVEANVKRAMQAGARYVVGTTGWADREAAVRATVQSAGGGLVHAANFSLGVHLFYQVVRHAAALIARFPEYDPYVLEKHHRKKKDAPSGTAKVLARHLEEASGGKAETALPANEALAEGRFHVAAVRAGGIIGEHVVGFDSGGDEILLEHRARSRRGFALGSVLAAEWIAAKTGFYSFEDVVADLAGGRSDRSP